MPISNKAFLLIIKKRKKNSVLSVFFIGKLHMHSIGFELTTLSSSIYPSGKGKCHLSHSSLACVLEHILTL